MNDRRRPAANARVAAEARRGQIDAPRFSTAAARQVASPVADLLHAPNGRRERQVVRGEPVTLYEDHDGWSFVALGRDGYVGYLDSDTLMPSHPVTHRVSARLTHLYPEANIKAPDICALSHMSRVQVLSQQDRFAETPDGFVPRIHLAPISHRESDPVSVAALYLGTPYLWGGNSGFGIDCSGLVQAACLSCGIPCPGDSDMQAAELGTPLPEDARLQRGDLLFWKGHVAWVSDPDTLLHANAFHMAVAREPIHDAINRIEAQGEGPVTARKRLGGHT